MFGAGRESEEEEQIGVRWMVANERKDKAKREGK